jgi:hypothetical protein
MDASQIPLGQKVVVADTPYIKSIFTRISEQDGFIEYFHPTNGTVVLKAKLGIHSGDSDIQYMDQDFWAVRVNGRPIAPGEQASGSMQINAEARTINVTTK